jgi:hypothetical protein
MSRMNRINSLVGTPFRGCLSPLGKRIISKLSNDSLILTEPEPCGMFVLPVKFPLVVFGVSHCLLYHVSSIHGWKGYLGVTWILRFTPHTPCIYPRSMVWPAKRAGSTYTPFRINTPTRYISPYIRHSPYIPLYGDLLSYKVVKGINRTFPPTTTVAGLYSIVLVHIGHMVHILHIHLYDDIYTTWYVW